MTQLPLLHSLQECIGETVPSTTWAFLWLADVEKLQDWQWLGQATEERVPGSTRLSLTNVAVGSNIIAKCIVKTLLFL